MKCNILKLGYVYQLSILLTKVFLTRHSLEIKNRAAAKRRLRAGPTKMVYSHYLESPFSI